MEEYMLNDDVFEQIKHFNHKEYENFPVVLKCLHNSQDITSDLLSEIETHHMIYSKHVDNITHCYGITKDPESRNFMMVMGYVINGSLRQHLNNNFNSTKWDEKLIILQSVAKGLACIHEYGLVHRDFHCEPKNAIDNKDDDDRKGGDNSLEEYSESIEAIDFTKLNLNKSN
ncbi:kinase-like domain-containing protein [Rhizophagus irregularis DAOM 181602=DAOM 197198]|nr:kinase-like domain-containing protein [Rhizophagus irregularis DAOM 181602=DAOM 197198]